MYLYFQINLEIDLAPKPVNQIDEIVKHFSSALHHSRSHTTVHFVTLHMRGEWLWWNTSGMEWTHVSNHLNLLNTWCFVYLMSSDFYKLYVIADRISL